MRQRWASLLAWATFGVSVVLFCFAMYWIASSPEVRGGGDIPFVSVFLLWGLVGAVIASRSSGNKVGWLFCGFALLGESTFAAQIYADRESLQGLTAAAEAAGWYETWAGDWLPPLLGTLLILVFPSGRLRTRFERMTAWFATAAFTAIAVASSIQPGRLPRHDFDNPLGVDRWGAQLRAAVEIGGFFVPLFFILALVALTRRMKSARGDEHAQLKWFVFAAAVVAFDLVLAAVVGILDIEGGDAIGTTLFLVGIAGLAVATAIAVLKYRLYDIDLVVNRTLVYACLTAILGGLYLGLVFLLQGVLGGLTQDSDIAVAGSTLAVAALFRPLRARVQSFIDRRFYRRKYDAQHTLESFSSRLRDEVDLDHLARDLVTVVRDTMQPAHASVWLRAVRS